MSDEQKKFRSSDDFNIRNARVMVVGELREINDDTELCSVKVVSQPGNEKDLDCWVTVTGKNGLARLLAGLNKGDRINAGGKPFFGAYVKDGKAFPTLEIKYPNYVDIVFRQEMPEPTDTEEVETEEEVEEIPPAKTAAPAKRGPGRPRKQLPFEGEE